jgi:hypothetical protein
VKILDLQNIYKENEKEYVVFKTFKNVTKIGNDKYLTYLSVWDIGEMFEKQQLCYYSNTQRGIKYRKINNKIVEKTIVKQSNINEMANLILKGELSVTQLTFNVLDNSKGLINYNKDKNELFIKGSLSILDGNHRVRACYKAYKSAQILDDPKLIENVKLLLFPIIILHLDDENAKNTFSQMSKGLKISKSLAESFDSTKASNRIATKLNEHSILKDRIDTRRTYLQKTDTQHIVTFLTLKTAIDSSFPSIKDESEEQEIYIFLSAFFNELINLFPNLIDENRLLFKEEYINFEDIFFYCYVSLAEDLYLKRKSNWKEEMKALENIDYSKDNSIWNCVIKPTRTGYTIVNNKSSRALMIRVFKQEFYSNL